MNPLLLAGLVIGDGGFFYVGWKVLDTIRSRRVNKELGGPSPVSVLVRMPRPGDVRVKVEIDEQFEDLIPHHAVLMMASRVLERTAREIDAQEGVEPELSTGQYL